MFFFLDILVFQFKYLTYILYIYVCMRACVRACVRVCVRARARARARVCVCVCVWGWICVCKVCDLFDKVFKLTSFCLIMP